jgi:hypothetical protein
MKPSLSRASSLIQLMSSSAIRLPWKCTVSHVPSPELLKIVQTKNSAGLEVAMLPYNRAAPAMMAPKKTAAFSALFWPAAPVYGEAVAGLTGLEEDVEDTSMLTQPLEVGDTGFVVVTMLEIGCHPLV